MYDTVRHAGGANTLWMTCVTPPIVQNTLSSYHWKHCRVLYKKNQKYSETIEMPLKVKK
jgi:hypothetical protein